MELATGGERTIDGIADGERVLLGHPKTREAMRAGLAMYFVTLEDPELMEIADRIVAELSIEHFFNIQLVGEQVIEINPRISTIVYQEDLNLAVPRRQAGARGDLGRRAGLAAGTRSGRAGRRCATSTRWSGTPERCRATARSGSSTAPSTPPACRGRTSRRSAAAASTPGSSSSSATSSIPEADWSLDRRGGFLRRQATQWRALARLLPQHGRVPLLLRAHARPAVAPVPDPASAPQEVRLPLPRLGHPRQDARRARLRQEGRRGDRRLATTRSAGCPRRR